MIKIIIVKSDGTRWERECVLALSMNDISGVLIHNYAFPGAEIDSEYSRFRDNEWKSISIIKEEK